MEPSTDPVPEEETEDYSESDSGANRDDLDQVIEDLMQAEQKKYIKIDNAHTSIKYIHLKTAQGQKRKVLTERISSLSQKTFIIRSAKNNKKQ